MLNSIKFREFLEIFNLKAVRLNLAIHLKFIADSKFYYYYYYLLHLISKNIQRTSKVKKKEEKVKKIVE